jgi:GNAT superfamily N-acetyltransferase
MSDPEKCCHNAPAGLALRIAAATDAELLSEFVRELAEFEGLSHECAITPEAVTEHLLGPKRCAGAIIAELDGKPAGFAVYYRTFSTFAAKPGIFLEDLYVRPDYRKRGLGRALLSAVAEIAHARSSGRLEWTALKWNKKALALYDAVGAKQMEEWSLLRMAPDAIRRLASADRAQNAECSMKNGTPTSHEGCRCGGSGPHHRKD